MHVLVDIVPQIKNSLVVPEEGCLWYRKHRESTGNFKSKENEKRNFLRDAQATADHPAYQEATTRACAIPAHSLNLELSALRAQTLWRPRGYGRVVGHSGCWVGES